MSHNIYKLATYQQDTLASSLISVSWNDALDGAKGDILCLTTAVTPKMLYEHDAMLSGFTHIELQSASHSDGRIFTLAYHLKQSLAYDGMILLSGHVIHDQYHYALECGIDAIIDGDHSFKASDFVTLRYQPFLTHDIQQNIWQQRHAK